MTQKNVASVSTGKKTSKSAPKDFFLPNFCALRPIFILCVGVQLLAFVIILATGEVLLESWDELGLLSFFMQWIALISALMMCLLRPLLIRIPVLVAAITSYILILMVTFGVAHIAQSFLITFHYQWGNSEQTLQDFVPRCLLISAIIALVALRYFYVQQQWKIQIKLESEARIDALQARIKPHFLFNSMNIIASLIHSKPMQAEQAVEDLSELFRATLRDTGSLVSLSTEWALCENYLRIEGLRLGGRMKIEGDLSAIPQDASIPMLTLQPLVENAIYHGIQPIPEGGTIHISASRNENELEIKLKNPLARNQAASVVKGNRIAMGNIKNRLNLLFGNSASVKVNQTADSYEVILTFPYVKHYG